MAARKGNQTGLIHGGGGAENKLATGDSFTGLAAITEQNVKAELETQGVDAIVERDAIRFQTVADLYYAAIMGAAAEGDLVKLERYVNKFGWIASHAVRAWAQVAETRKAQSKLTAVEVLREIRGNNGGGE